MKFRTLVFRTATLLVFAWVIIFEVSIHPVQAAPTEQTTDIEIEMCLVNEENLCEENVKGENKAFPGQFLEYVIIVRNTSNDSYPPIQIQANYDEELLSIEQTIVKEGIEILDIQPIFVPDTLIFNLEELRPNTEYHIEYSAWVTDLITLEKNNTSEIKNTAVLSVDGKEKARSEVLIKIATFSIEKEATSDGIIHNHAGEPTEMVLRVQNNTDIDFEEVEVYDLYNLPSSYQANEKGVTIKNINIISDTETIDDIVEIIKDDPSWDDYVYWTLGPMKAGKTREIKYTIEFDLKLQDTDKKLINTADVWALFLDNYTLIAQTKVPEELLVEPPPPEIKMNRTVEVESLQDKKTFASEIRLGDSVQFTIEIVNVGITPATNVKVTDEFEGNIYAEDFFKISPKHNGRRDGSSTVWEISEIKPGETIELKYDVKLKEGLFAENQTTEDEIKLTHTASISIDGIPQETTADVTFTVRKLMVLNDISIVDLNGAAIVPGDTLRVTIPIENKLDSTDPDIQIVVNYDLIENLKFNNLGSGSLDQALGQIIWTKSLDPGETSISFDLLLPSKIKEPLTFKLNVSISRSGTKLALTEKSITVEPSITENTPSGITGLIPSNQNNFVLIFSLVVAMIIGSFVLLALIAKYLATKDRLYGHMQDLIEMFTIVVIISTMLVLSMVTTIGENAAIGILSGIAGYVLGSRATRSIEVDASRDQRKISNGKPASESQANILDLARKSVLEVLNELLADGETLSLDKPIDASLANAGQTNEVEQESNLAGNEEVEK